MEGGCSHGRRKVAEGWGLDSRVSFGSSEGEHVAFH